MEIEFGKKEIIITFICAVLIIGFLLYPHSYVEKTTLENQYLKSFEYDGVVYDNVLFIEVGEVFVDIPDVAYPIKENATYFFAGEHKLLGIENGERITITWKYIPFTGYRIRGLEKL
ncbi:MAG: hypothetical protein WC415_06090 [Patescibacteria group bacterium]|jgi:hypothetical protein